MPKCISDSDLYPIETLLADRHDGWRIGEIEKALESQGLSFNRRTLQRRLARLEKAGKILIAGAGRATLYLPIVTTEKSTETNDGISLSIAAQEIQNRSSRPLSARQPVNYQREFIDLYQPNVTWYLPAAIRNHLLDIGRRIGIDYAAGTYIRQILDRLLIDLSWASSRLEGNTYSLLETERLIAFGQPALGKTPFETQMVLNHKAAIEFLVDAVDEIGFDRRTILNLNALLSDNLLGNPSASGRLRAIPVGIGKSVYEPPAVPQLIDEIFGQILDTAVAISDPFEQAFFVTLHLPYLQPFEDVNKRVSRLAANIPLIHHNLCPLSFMDVPEDLYINGLLGVYELNRKEEIAALHEGNFARYRLRPAEYNDWQKRKK